MSEPKSLPPDVPIPGDAAAEAASDDRILSVARGNLIWPILLSLLVLLIIGMVNYQPGSLRSVREALNPWILLLAPLVLILRVVIGGFRLRFISHGQLDLKQGLRGQLLWDFSSNVTPSTVGGAPLAAVFIARDSRVPIGEITAVMLFAMLLDQIWFTLAITSLLVASLFLDLYPAAIGKVGSWVFTLYFFGVLAWTSLFAYATMVRPRVLEVLIEKLFSLRWLKRFKARAMAEMSYLRDRTMQIRAESIGFFLKGFLYSSCVWLCRYLSLLLVVWSVYAALPKLLFFFRTVAMMMGALVIPTPGGSGGLEGMYALFFNPIIPKGTVAPTLLVWRFLAYYVPTAIGVALSAQVVRRAIARRIVQPAPGPRDAAEQTPIAETDR